MDDAEPPRWLVSRRQRSRAKTLRGNLTDAEQHLWSGLRGHRLCGLSFRRQHPLGPYITDFACLPTKLVIEVDGGQHYEDAGQLKDARRDQFFKERGFTVLRFSNLDVLQNLS
ncbi:endonuclease domain-containing protein [Xanthobacter agilis]|uniref:Very-short-patch-repair endonuclease n=1 Tax=Xanthobacter agilis TaxID=47492 RepID=A0ABU0L8V0_XANAG|nr:endonuclease domain-containing protein [Xanthobacter agilis]MDQ0503574.1 very-short-patch-repair endonuclease [Xanthobacter agilis]